MADLSNGLFNLELISGLQLLVIFWFNLVLFDPIKFSL